MLACGVILNGCASAGYEKSDVAADTLQDASTQVYAESIAIDATVATLNDLIDNPAPDLKPQFDKFNIALNRLTELEVRNEKSAERTSRKTVAYFDKWDKQLASIDYEAVRKESAARKAAVKDRFNSVSSRYHETQEVVQPLITYFEDIRTALSTDLTRGGLESVKSLAANAEQGARKVQVALGQLSDDLAASGAEMSSANPPQDTGSEVEAKGGAAGNLESDHAEARQ